MGPHENEQIVAAAHTLLSGHVEGERKGLFGFFDRLSASRRARALAEVVGPEVVKAVEAIATASQSDTQKAKENAARVAASHDSLYLWGMHNVREKTGRLTFRQLRNLGKNCAPARACIQTRRRQVSAFGKPAKRIEGRYREPGFIIRLTDEDAKPTPGDRKEMTRIRQFLMECGYTRPPRTERNINWQPGFANFLKMLLQDSLTLDFAVMRMWESATNPRKYPVVAFAAEDAGRIRRVRQDESMAPDGRTVLEEWEGQRDNTDEEIEYVQYAMYADEIINEFTETELAHWIRNPESDVESNGYGFGELETAYQEIEDFINGKQYNSDRFRRDNLPRGFLTLLGSFGAGAIELFRTQWKEMMEGNRWGVPVLQGNPQSGVNVQWTPVDQSSRDMEYANWMHFVALWIHADFGLSTEETGYADMNQTKPSLSENDPESQIEYSEDKGLRDVTTSLAEFLNLNILYRLYPDRDFTLEFVGLGQGSELTEEQIIQTKLANGTTTPGRIWKQRDQEIDKELEADPLAQFAMRMPMPFAQGYQLGMSIQQAQAQTEQAGKEGAANQAATEQATAQADVDGQRNDEKHAMEQERHEADMEDRDVQAEMNHQALKGQFNNPNQPQQPGPGTSTGRGQTPPFKAQFKQRGG